MANCSVRCGYNLRTGELLPAAISLFYCAMITVMCALALYNRAFGVCIKFYANQIWKFASFIKLCFVRVGPLILLLLFCCLIRSSLPLFFFSLSLSLFFFFSFFLFLFFFLDCFLLLFSVFLFVCLFVCFCFVFVCFCFNCSFVCLFLFCCCF